jgi:ABC-type sugar transport system ATPase subunit
MAKVVLEDIGKAFGNVEAVKDFNLTIEDRSSASWWAPRAVGSQRPSG